MIKFTLKSVKKNKRNKIYGGKAQVFTWDLVFSLTIFLIILGILIYLWNTSIWNVYYSEEMYKISWLAKTISEQLVRTPGFPRDWHLKEPEDLVVIGLTYSDQQNQTQDRVLDADKLIHFINLTIENYTFLRNKLLSTGEYNFYIEFICLNQSENCWKGVPIKTIGNASINCSNNANFTIINNTLNLQGEPRCIVGRYATPSSSILLAKEKKIATFKEKLNSTIVINLIIWKGISVSIPLIPVMTTTTTLPPGTLICNIFTKGSCPGGFNEYTRIFSLYNYTNSHAGIPESYGSYDVCCKVKDGILTSYNTTSGCLAGDGCVVSLLYEENSHAEECSTGLYENDICINTSLGEISCTLYHDSSCPEGKEAVASLYDTTNAHVGRVGDYGYTICCGVTIVETTTTTTTTISLTTTTVPATTTTTLPTLSCSIETDGGGCSSGTCIFTMYSTSGGHAATCTASEPYDNEVCCLIDSCLMSCTVETAPNTCSGDYKPVIYLYQETNAHVQDPSIGTYDKRICCDASSCGGSLSCVIRANSCEDDEECLGSMYQLDNSHIGDCSAFSQYKICCKLT